MTEPKPNEETPSISSLDSKDGKSIEQTGTKTDASSKQVDTRNESLSPSIVGKSGTTEDLFRLISEPLSRDNGFRVLWLGDSGQGKSYANNLLVNWLIKNRLLDLVLTTDTKDAFSVTYPGGCERVNPQDLRQRPPYPGESRQHINFRGVAATRKLSEDVDIDDVARLAWEISTKKKTKVLVNIDELSDATNGGQAWQSKTVAASYRKGRGVGMSITATTQLPQTLPREAFALSDIIVLFRMSGREAGYLEEKRAITPEGARIVPTLTVGTCFIYDKARGPLDGSVIKIEG